MTTEPERPESPETMSTTESADPTHETTDAPASRQPETVVEAIGAPEEPQEAEDAPAQARGAEPSTPLVAAPDPEDRAPAGPLIIAVLAVLGGLAALAYLALFPSTPPAYTVAGEETSREAFVEEVTGLAPELADVAADPESADPAQQGQLAVLMTGLIVEDALEARADTLGLEVGAADVDDELEAILADTFGGDQAAFDEAIGQSGLSDAGVRQQIRTTLLVNALAEAAEGEEVSEEDIQAFYDAQVNTPTVSHILVETEAEAEDVLARLEDGEAFEDLAAELSIDPGSGQAGGALGPYRPGTFVPPFEEAVEAAEPGDTVGPVETDFGFHIIRVEEPPTLEEVRSDIVANLEGQGLNTRIQDLLTELEADLEVTVDEAYGTWTGLLQGGVQPPQPTVQDLPLDEGQ